MNTAAPRLVVPAYFHPAVAPQDWATLATLAAQVRLVILNIASGPGDVRDPAFTEVLAMLHRGGVAVAGYVDTDYGRRPARTIGADVARYRSWYPQVRAVFLDRVAATGDLVGHYAASPASAPHGGDGDGRVPPRGASRPRLRRARRPARHVRGAVDELPQPRGAVVGPQRPKRAVPAPRAHRAGGLLPTARRLAASRNAGAAYVTDLPGVGPDGQNPWTGCAARRTREGPVRIRRAVVAWMAVGTSVVGGCAAAPTAAGAARECKGIRP